MTQATKLENRWFTPVITFLFIHCIAFLVVCAVQYVNIVDLEDKISQRRQQISKLGLSCGVRENDKSEIKMMRVERTLENLSLKNEKTKSLLKRINTGQVSTSSFMQGIITAQMEMIKKHCTNDTVICIPGAVGTKGIKGGNGTQGVKGDLGIAGDKGPVGFPGAKGFKGISGQDGATGQKGERGVQGPQGTRGTIGDKGPKGHKGVEGDKGNPGNQGEHGDKGEMGPTGTKGPQGLKGLPGDVGDVGPPGIKGVRGDTGSKGPDALPPTCDCIRGAAFLSNVGVIQTHYGSNVTLDCSVNDTVGVTTIFHRINGSSCRPVTNFPVTNGILHIDSVQPVDIGQYQCDVTTSTGTITKTITLQTSDTKDILNCNFESNLCYWKQSSTDETDWKINHGETYTSGTGPTVDHTIGTDAGHYIYFDASKSSPGEAAKLESMFIQTTQPHCLSLWTHMYGDDIGGIAIYFHLCGKQFKIWEANGDKGDYWNQIRIDIPPHPDGAQIIIEAIRGKGIFGDIAVDDISWIKGTCASTLPHFFGQTNETIITSMGSSTKLNCSGVNLNHVSWEKQQTCTRIRSTSEIYNIPNVKLSDSGKYTCSVNVTGQTIRKNIDLIVNGSLICDFENGSGMCGWSQSRADTFEWIKQSRGTPSQGTGPTNDHTTNTGIGHYMYIEASSKSSGDNARLESPLLPAGSDVCFKLWYNMYGTGIGELKVRTKDCSGSNMVLDWETSGDKGQDWLEKCIHISPQQTDFQLIIEGVRGNDYKGDIAIDDLELSLTKQCVCDGGINKTCDFESGLCEWHQDHHDDFDWISNRRQTPTSGTGPVGDHTVNGTGQYIYIESSAPRRSGDRAILESSRLPAGHDYCLTFWYNMYGSSMGTLNVYTEGTSSGLKVLQFNRTGDHGQKWYQARVHIPSQKHEFTIQIEGVIGSGISSDLALDDITIGSGPCL